MNKLAEEAHKFLSKLFCSLLIAFFVAQFLIIVSSDAAISVSFFAFLGGLISFLLFQILQFFLQKFLEKQLTFNEFSYIKQGFSIVRLHLLFLLLTFFLLFFSVWIHVKEDSSISEKLIEDLTMKNPFQWIFCLNILFFFYRINSLKEKLIRLQKNFKVKEEN